MDMSAHGGIEQRSARRLRVTTLIAAAIHALVLGLVATRKAPPQPVAPAIAASEPIAIELDARPETPRAEEAPREKETPEPAAEAPRPKRPRHAVVGPAPAPPSRDDGSAGAGEVAGPGAAPPSSTGTSASPAAGGSAVALAVPADALPPPLVPRAIHAPRDVLEAPLAGRTTSADQTASAQVMATVQRLSRGEGAPRNAHGTVRIVVDEDGAVSGVTTTSPSWAAVATAIRAALGGRRFRVPRGAHGVVISFSVDAKVTNVPAFITGDARAKPTVDVEALQGSSPSDKPSRMAVISPLAVLPVPRHVVKVELLGEEPR